ncbi:insulin-like [Lingula anatina]|uniref:Insulin-like n=1 Tax=Lingula anatina TaxID=7574 RepID=A0A1S3KBB5_LINAN|nr:insulin-like [Lingula anatina]|eukprot:XP_013419782.1 insulin-like [Lingula anatina]
MARCRMCFLILSRKVVCFISNCIRSKQHNRMYKSYSLIIGTVIVLSLCHAALSENLCGKSLADTLDLVCFGRGFNYNPSAGKRLAPMFLSKRAALPFLISKRHDTDLASSTATNLSNPDGLQPRRKRGIVEECCKKSCSWSVLESYCASAGSAGPGSVNHNNGDQETFASDLGKLVDMLTSSLEMLHPRGQKRNNAH